MIESKIRAKDGIKVCVKHSNKNKRDKTGKRWRNARIFAGLFLKLQSYEVTEQFVSMLFYNNK